MSKDKRIKAMARGEEAKIEWRFSLLFLKT